MIRLANIEDFDFVYSLYFHSTINPFLLYEMMNKADFQPIFEDLRLKNQLFIFEQNENKIGMFKLYGLTYRTSHIAYLGGLAISPDFGGLGFGKMMLEEIIVFAKMRGFLRIELSVAVQNEKAIYLYEKAGFVKEGILRNYTYLKSENRFLDEYIMSYLQD
jgi:putative acetyltransferase